jgi:signal peptidase II
MAGITWLIVDQVTKVVVRSTMHVGDSIDGFIPHLINLTFVRNSGAAFGLFPGQRPVFVLTSLLVLFVIAAYWRRAHPRQWPVVVAFALIAGGSVGNLIDRAFIGRVTDFFEFAFVEFPVFNVADIGIVLGVAILMVWILFGPEPPANAATGGESSDDEASGSSEAEANARPGSEESGRTPVQRVNDVGHVRSRADAGDTFS